MTVKELTAKLQKALPDKIVRFRFDGGVAIRNIELVFEHEHFVEMGEGGDLGCSLSQFLIGTNPGFPANVPDEKQQIHYKR
jgi:hypothetical protein